MSCDRQVRTSLTLPEHAKVFSSNWRSLRDSITSSSGQASRVKKKEDRIHQSKHLVKSGTVKKKKGIERGAKAKMEKSVKKNDTELGGMLALDCEFVGGGHDGSLDILARISLVDGHLNCVYDKFVRTDEKIKDYRTAISGVRPHDIANGEHISIVRREVAALLSGRLLIGHGVNKDLQVIGLTHSPRLIRDTSTFQLFHYLLGTKRPKLKALAGVLLGEEIQNGEHSSVEDASATMKLYLAHRSTWEKRRIHR